MGVYFHFDLVFNCVFPLPVFAAINHQDFAAVVLPIEF